MIYTITLNPAIDHIIISDKKVELDITNYYSSEYEVIGGKGINSGIILNNLESNVEAICFLGKENKDLFLNEFNKMKLKTKKFIIDGKTRVNYKIKNLSSHQETELNGFGFNVGKENVEELLKYLKDNLKENDIIMCSGSSPIGVEKDIYGLIGKICNENKALFICDATNELMINALKQKPYLIKPNLEEICSTLKIEYNPNLKLDEIKKLILKLRELGARNVLLSMGSQGSLYFDENNDIYKTGIAKGELVNSVGSGDSMLAGFAYGLSSELGIVRTLQYGAASGGATAFTSWLATKKEIEDLVDSIKVEKV